MDGQQQLEPATAAPATVVSTSTAATLAVLEETGRRYDAHSRAALTWAAYQRDWRHLTTW